MLGIPFDDRNTVAIGFVGGTAAAPRATPAATSSARVTSGGTYSATTESMFGSLPTILSTARNVRAVPTRSCRSGSAGPHASGRIVRSEAMLAGVSDGRTSPCASHASARRMPGPPAFVTTPTRCPPGSAGSRGATPRRTSVRASRHGSRRSARTARRCRRRGSRAMPSGSMQRAFLRPMRPDFTATIGVLRATFGASRANARGLPKLSR